MPLAALGPILIGAAGTSAAATTAAWGAIGAGAAGLGSAAINAHAAGSAADTTSAAANHAADLKAQADAEALAFQKEQSENAFQNSEAARAGNYGMYAAGAKRLKSAGESLGIPGASDMEIPAYVPGVDPHLTGTSPGAALTGATGPTSGNPLDDAAIADQLTKNYQALGVKPTGPGSGPTDIAYMQQRIKETGGLTPQNMAYWFGPQGRIASELSKSGAPGTTSTPSAGSYLTPYAPVAQAPALQMPTAGTYLGAA